MNPKLIKFLENLHKATEGGAVQPEELIKISDTILGIIKSQGEKLEKSINDVDSDKESKINSLKADLDTQEYKLNKAIDAVKTNSDKTLEKKVKALSKEIENVMLSIPEATDLTELENKIEIVRKEIPKLPEEIKADDIKKMLESLKDGNRLDASAIKNLPEGVREVIQHVGFPETQIKAGSNVTVRKDASGTWVISSTGGGGGGGASVETPSGTVNGSNVTFTVGNEPLYVVADGLTYFDGAGYSYSGGTITMTSPPFSFIRSFY